MYSRLSIHSHNSLRLKSQMSRLRQVLVNLSSLILGIITYQSMQLVWPIFYTYFLCKFLFDGGKVGFSRSQSKIFLSLLNCRLAFGCKLKKYSFCSIWFEFFCFFFFLFSHLLCENCKYAYLDKFAVP